MATQMASSAKGEIERKPMYHVKGLYGAHPPDAMDAVLFSFGL